MTRSPFSTSSRQNSSGQNAAWAPAPEIKSAQARSLSPSASLQRRTSPCSTNLIMKDWLSSLIDLSQRLGHCLADRLTPKPRSDEPAVGPDQGHGRDILVVDA